MTQAQLIPRIVDLSIKVFHKIPNMQELWYYAYLERELSDEYPPITKEYIKDYVQNAIRRLYMNSVLKTQYFSEFQEWMVEQDADAILRAFILVQWATSSPEFMWTLLAMWIITQEDYDDLVPNE